MRAKNENSSGILLAMLPRSRMAELGRFISTEPLPDPSSRQRRFLCVNFQVRHVLLMYRQTTFYSPQFFDDFAKFIEYLLSIHVDRSTSQSGISHDLVEGSSGPSSDLRRLDVSNSTDVVFFCRGQSQMAKFAVSMGARSLTIRFLPEDPDFNCIDLSKPELLEFIQTLGIAHQLLPDNSAQQRFSDKEIDLNEAVETPWRLEITPLLKITTIYFDHPCFGTLSFMISRETVKSLLQSLSHFLEMQTGGRKPN